MNFWFVISIASFLLGLPTLKKKLVPKETKIFDASSLHGFRRISESCPSPDGNWVVYSVHIWNKESGKTTNHLQATNIKSKETINLTEPTPGISDFNPVFSSTYPEFVLFLRYSGIQNNVFYIDFPPKLKEPSPTPKQLTNYPLEVWNLKVSADSLVFSANVHVKCSTLKCSLDEDIIVESHTWQVYNKLLVRHWNRWLPEGKARHLFLQKIKKDPDTMTLKLVNDPIDLMQNLEMSSPPLTTDAANFDISPDGNEVAFSGLERTREEAWNTHWKTMRYNLNYMKAAQDITQHTQARTQNPRYSKDGTKIAYLATKAPMLDSEIVHLEIFYILTNKLIKVPVTIDRFITDFQWIDDSTIIFTANDIGYNRLYLGDLTIPERPVFTLLVRDEFSYSLPNQFGNSNTFVALRSSYTRPHDFCLLNLNMKKRTATCEELTNINADKIVNFQLSSPEMFFFEGEYHHQVQGWIIPPINCDKTKTYPAAFLIHGGPEDSWTSFWSYIWNPQLWANRGYAVILINHHGSTGRGMKFQEAVRNDWGGAPYKDLMKGLEYVLKRHTYIDSKRICAAGGSYGGYMVNWIQGHNTRFQCLVTHDGTFSSVSNFYNTDELWFERAEFCPKNKIGCFPFDSKEIKANYEKNCPEKFVKNWVTPHLVIHSGLDYRIPISEGLSTFTALQLKGVPSRLLYFPMESHLVLKAENSIKWYDEVLGWMDKYTTKK